MSYIDNVYDFESHPKTPYPDDLARYLTERYKIKTGSKLLEVGCGRGDFINAFSELEMEAYGIDIEDRHDNILDKIIFEKTNIEDQKIPFEDNFFDIVFTKSVIEHIENYHHFIAECKRVLRNNGKVIVMTPDWKSCCYLFYDDYSHIHPYTEVSLRDLLQVHDFKNVKAEVFYQLPVLWKYPLLKLASKALQVFGSPRKIVSNKFIRWSRELMILCYGEK